MPRASPETRRASTGVAAVSPRPRISSMPPRTTDVPSTCPSNAAAFDTLRGHGHTSWRHKRGGDPSQRVATLRGREVRGVANSPSSAAGGRSISSNSNSPTAEQRASSELGGARATIAPVPAPSGGTQVATPPTAGDEQEDEGGQQRVSRGWLARAVVRYAYDLRLQKLFTHSGLFCGCLLRGKRRAAKQQRRVAPDTCT